MTRGIIYCRVSTEQQSGEDRTSISEQARACQELADKLGIKVVKTIIDDKRYKSGSRMVSPSGTRSDRPGYLELLRMIDEGAVDVVLAFAEDRLARGIYAAIPLGRTLEDNPAVTIQLVNGVFDTAFFFIKAAIGKIELDMMKARMNMGLRGRLRKNKLWATHIRYGYELDDEDNLVINEEQAYWVRWIYQSYLDGVNVMEMKKLLIAANAPVPARKSGPHTKLGWCRATIQCILTYREYSQGFDVVKAGGEEFRVPCPPIIEPAIAAKVQDLRVKNRSNPSGPVLSDYLVRKMVYCPCGKRWAVRTIRFRAGGKLRKTPVGQYICPAKTDPECPHSMSARKLDRFVWDFVLRLLADPQRLMEAVNDALRRTGQDKQLRDDRADAERVEKELSTIPSQRDWVITQARLRRISDQQMVVQLGQIDEAEVELRGRLHSLMDTVGREADLREWAADVTEFMGKIDVEDLLTYDEYLGLPAEERTMQFDSHRELVELFIEKVIVRKGADPEFIMKYSVNESSNGIVMNRPSIYLRVLSLGVLCGAEVSVRA